MRDPIIITGIPRSGISMVSGIVFLCGAYGGVLSPPSKSQKKQLYQNPLVDKHIVEKFKNKPLHQEKKIKYIQDFCLGAFRQAGDRVWFVKNPDILLQWNLWYRAFPNAWWVIVRRDKKDLIQSCMNTSYMNQCSTVFDWDIWIEQRIDIINRIKLNASKVWEIWPQDIINGDFYEIEHCVNAMSLPWKEQDVIKHITPALYSEYKRNYKNGKDNARRCYCYPW